MIDFVKKERVMKRILKFGDFKNCLFTKEDLNNKDLKVKPTMYILKKLTRLH